MPYELDEKANWGMNIDTLKKAVAKAQGEGKLVRGMVFINPGNPTGAIVFRCDRVCSVVAPFSSFILKSPVLQTQHKQTRICAQMNTGTQTFVLCVCTLRCRPVLECRQPEGADRVCGKGAHRAHGG